MLEQSNIRALNTSHCIACHLAANGCPEWVSFNATYIHTISGANSTHCCAINASHCNACYLAANCCPECVAYSVAYIHTNGGANSILCSCGADPITNSATHRVTHNIADISMHNCRSEIYCDRDGAHVRRYCFRHRRLLRSADGTWPEERRGD
jgi:hypothetical protein